MPKLAKQTLFSWYKKRSPASTSFTKKIYFFCDEFTNYTDVAIGKKAILLLEALGYAVIIPKHIESGRAYLSKGLVKKAALIANKNIDLLAGLITKETPLIGVEPSAILTLRDEYIDLASEENYPKAKQLATSTFTIEEFLANQSAAGMIDKNLFTDKPKNVLIHGHCYQKALSSQQFIRSMVEIPENYSATLIPSGCCGMAGGFGYEKEHYLISQQIGELVLFPAVRAAAEHETIVASGTSCRHQIKDGTKKEALHPVELLYDALLIKAVS